MVLADGSSISVARLVAETGAVAMAGAFAVTAFAISLSTFGSNWNWWGYPAAWNLVQVVDFGEVGGDHLAPVADGFVAEQRDCLVGGEIGPAGEGPALSDSDLTAVISSSLSCL